jgi:HTH-type transcriptional regulator / antitoxin HipB
MDSTARTPDQLAQVLKVRRKKQRLSQTQVGIRAGIRQDTVSALELRPGSSSVDSLYKVLSTLGLELVIRDKGSSTSSKEEW